MRQGRDRGCSAYLLELFDFLQRLHELLNLPAGGGGVVVVQVLDLVTNRDEPLLQVLVLLDARERLVAGEVLA